MIRIRTDRSCRGRQHIVADGADPLSSGSSVRSVPEALDLAFSVPQRVRTSVICIVAGTDPHSTCPVPPGGTANRTYADPPPTRLTLRETPLASDMVASGYVP